MATPSTPSSHPPPSELATPSSSTSNKTRKTTRLRSLASKLVGAKKPVIHVDPVTGKVDGPHRKKLRTYLGIVARDKVDVIIDNWKQVPIARRI